jgi:hypothetical protein
MSCPAWLMLQSSRWQMRGAKHPLKLQKKTTNTSQVVGPIICSTLTRDCCAKKKEVLVIVVYVFSTKNTSYFILINPFCSLSIGWSVKNSLAFETSRLSKHRKNITQSNQVLLSARKAAKTVKDFPCRTNTQISVARWWYNRLLTHKPYV